ncbi:pre-60S factor rei1 [Vanrija albida]|uniref:Pre-60S factor rei1 n=1 Tax=Vanrija albida TaxID=181172 RepID=A0ABR3Q1R0_9TREE
MFTCISCRIAFETAEEQRSHFGTDWHRYNMKRRVANLPPVSASAFNEKVIERREQNAVRPDPRDMICNACSKQFSTENSYRSHVQSKKHRERQAALARAPASATAPPTAEQAASSSSTSFPRVSEEVDEEEDEVDEESDDDEMDIEAAIAASRRKIGPTDCLFCNHRAADVQASLTHMSSTHSFFIPDQELLIDLDGLLGYLGEKVALGNLCLYCPNGGKEFGSLEAVRKHMIDKSHCKIAYDTEEDRIELSDFYKFGGSDESDWEDVDDGMDGDAQNGGMPHLTADGLSLTLPSGRTIGHRALKVYYAQRHRPSTEPQEDPTKAKVALVRQRLADPTSSLVPVAGGHGAYGRGLETVKARNAGEATWAKKQAKAFKDQRTREDFKTKVGFRHNSQKHFRDPLLQ